jgi:hypothetical protein
MFWLEIASDIATIQTAIIAVAGGIFVFGRGLRRRWRLERYLRKIRELDLAVGRNGRRTPLRLSADLAMTVPDILEAAFSSDKIKSSPAIDQSTKRASAIFLEYTGI